jgi:hypothetical protein
MLTPEWKPYECDPANPAHRQQAAFIASPARYKCLPCGRSGGKTDLCLRQLVYSLALPNGGAKYPATGEFTHNGFAFCAPTREQAKKIAWLRIKALIPKHWVSRVFESELMIETNVGGVKSMVCLVGMDRPQRFEGPHWWCGVIIDECSEIKRGTFDSSVEPALIRRGAWVIFAGRPKRSGVGAGWYKKLCEFGLSGEDPDLATFHWKSTTLLPADDIAKLRRTKDPKTFREEYEAEWITAGGACFYQFDYDDHVKPVVYDPTRMIHCSWDFNVDPLTAVLFHWDGKQMKVFDELFERESYTQKALDVLYTKYGNHKSGWVWHGDATATQRSTTHVHGAPPHNYATIENDRRLKPAKMEIPRSNPGILDRVASANALLRNAAREIHVEISESCEHLIKDLMERNLDDKGMPSEGKTGDLIGHISDAWSYGCHYLAPSTRIAPSAARFHVG